MKRIINFMLTALLVLATSCSGYDDTPIRAAIDSLNDKLEQLENLAVELNRNILGVREFYLAAENGDTILSCEELENGKGYKIIFAEAGEVVVYMGNDVVDEGWSDGEPGVAPVVGAVADEDGNYYWTIDGDPLCDKDGNVVYLTMAIGEDGAIPQLRVNDGKWQVSYNGTDWADLGASSATDPFWFSKVEETSEAYVFTLRSGEQVTISKSLPLSLVISGYENLKLSENITTALDYVVYGATSKTKVYAVSNCALTVTVQAESFDKGQILLFTDTYIEEGNVLVYADNGYGSTSMRMFAFKAGELDIIDIEGYDKPTDFDWDVIEKDEEENDEEL